MPATTHEDEVLFKVLKMQSGIADQARKRGRLRPASAALDRGFKEGQIRAKAGQPAGLLACASVRLQSCALLSSFQKHPEALEEACAAVLEMDKLWKELTMANGFAAAAVRDHRNVSDALRHSKVPVALQELMLKPPKWLEQAVTVSVEAKHCVALELEYCLPPDPNDLSASYLPRPGSASGVGPQKGQTHSSKQGRPWSAPTTATGGGVKVGRGTFMANVCGDDDVTWALSVASAGVSHLKDPWGLIERLHSEGTALAELLLEDGHPVLERSRRTEWQARGRNPFIAGRLAEEEQDAAEKAAEEARRLAAVEAERRAAEEAARKAAQQEAERKAAEEAARVAALWHPNTDLGTERAVQIAEHRKKVEEMVDFKAEERARSAALGSAVQKPPMDRGSVSAQKPKKVAGLILDETPKPTKQEVAAGFLREMLPDSAAAAHLHRIKTEIHDEDALQRTVIAREVMMGASPPSTERSFPEAQRPSTAGAQSSSAATPASKRPGSAPSKPGRVRRGSAGQVRTASAGAPDMFTEWKAEQSSWNQLTYIQKKMASEAGIDDMRVYLRREGQRFTHGYLKEITPENLYENRVNFAPSMMAVKRQQERHGLLDDAHDCEPAFPAPSCHDLSRAMKRTWTSLYGFRDKASGEEKRKQTIIAKDFGGLLGGASLFGAKRF